MSFEKMSLKNVPSNKQRASIIQIMVFCKEASAKKCFFHIHIGQ